MNFHAFATRIKDQFDMMSKHELFTVATGDEMWDAYLAAFPEGSNPIYRKRTEHDCSCCRNFIRNVGNVVAVIDGEVVSVWDVQGLDYPYFDVATSLGDLARSHGISGVFRAREPKYGDESTYERTEDGSKRWDHFHAKIAARHYAGKEREAVLGEINGIQQVFKRGLDELKPDALDTVLDLINSNALYRGEEHKRAVESFRALQRDYHAAPLHRDIFVWANLTHPAARFRNTVIGTLVQDLSEGVELEKAVKSFEAKVAPTNYKRPTALITPRMIQDAMKTIADLGLEPALERRFAKISDVSVNNVLWVDNSVRGQMKGGVEGLLMDAVKAPAKVNGDKAEGISIDDFMSSVLPQATGMDVFVKNAQQGNFMSLTAPVHADAERLFKWDNGFAWSYNGNITDSIKERVKKAGGSVEGDLCCRLAWEYQDDLDFHMIEPGGHHIYYSYFRRSKSPNGGMLDLDANGIDGLRDDPAENIYYASRRTMKEGVYELYVHNFRRRSSGAGFQVEIEFDGQVTHIGYERALGSGDKVVVAKIEYKAGQFRIIESLPSSQTSRGVWGVNTETFTKVTTLMQSPNHWDDNAVGNKHWFFVLDGCVNDQPTRGIYNEFLRGDLDKHRKVFEILGDKTKCQPTEGQLSGLGFSSTRGDTVLVNVTGPKIRKLYNITF